ncbi:hypothetical protein [Pseudomonas aeruginosa]|uniref:hypothetical protein n=1 Tax=Pseudomonas aeruginosa TaxID=287 RepID=UPI0012602570|nr:hypothetical protein [Pseudomonas aeruginosa]
MDTVSPVRREGPSGDSVSGNDQDQRLLVLQLPDDASVTTGGPSVDTATVQMRSCSAANGNGGDGWPARLMPSGVLAIDLRQGAGREVGVPN